ncbi:MAG: exodeoxyribonuclease III [Desulfobacterales bacterium]|jgi:exodeoxyribonuclease-3
MGNRPIRLISWNVNGLRAVWKKGFQKAFEGLDADIFSIQESKLQDHQLTDDMRNLPAYGSWWSHASVKKGYSGVGVYSRLTPQRVAYGIDAPVFDEEGRILELDFGDFVLFNVYFPNGQMNEDRLNYKLDFYRDFFTHADRLREAGRYVIVTGDFNTAHNDIDLKNPKANENTSGFLRIERDWIDRIVANGWVDAFRHFHPDTEMYSWWTYRFRARERNIGWRIDYFFVTENMIHDGRVTAAFIDNSIMGSDHCPVGLDIEMPSN